MGQILKFPAPAKKFGFKRVRKRSGAHEHPDQLQLFPSGGAQILEFTPASGWFEQALLWDERDDPKAAELYLKSIEVGESVADAFCNLGIIESQKGQTAKAFDCFTTCLKHEPRHPEAHYNLGNLYFDVNDLKLAQVHYEIAAEIDASFGNVFFNLALLHAIIGDLPASLSALAKYKELVPEPEARQADELLRELKNALAAARRALAPRQ